MATTRDRFQVCSLLVASLAAVGCSARASTPADGEDSDAGVLPDGGRPLTDAGEGPPGDACAGGACEVGSRVPCDPVPIGPAYTSRNRLTYGTRWSAPSLAWTGDGFGVAWADPDNQLVFARLDDAGERSAPDVALTDDAERDDKGRHPQVVFSGEGFGVVWAYGDPSWFAAIGADGAVLRAPAALNSSLSRGMLQMVWNGSSHVVVEGRHATAERPFWALHSSLVGLGGDVTARTDFEMDPASDLSDTTPHLINHGPLALVPHAGGYWLWWARRDGLSWVPLDGSGTPAAAAIRSTASAVENISHLSVATDGSSFAVTWRNRVSIEDDTSPFQLWFQRFDSTGAAAGPATEIATIAAPPGSDGDFDPPDVSTIVWADGAYGLAWTEGTRTAGSTGLLFRRVDPDGSMSETVVAGEESFGATPTVVWTGTAFVAAWIEIDAPDDTVGRLVIASLECSPVGDLI